MKNNNTVTDINKIRSCILGLAVADALGVPVEFRSREALAYDPVTDMREYGSHHVPAGTWSDDTSMTLCAIEALTHDCFTWNMVMDNFVRWYKNGDFSPTGTCFDIGMTCSEAINRYLYTGRRTLNGPENESSNGNGALMRIIPFILYSPSDISFIEKAAGLTHNHIRTRTACGIYAFILNEILNQPCKESVYIGMEKARAYYMHSPEWHHFEPLLKVDKRSRDTIRSGGYVVDTLEAAVWCLLTTDTYDECVLKAVNLGKDTDTTAAVAGGLAGALYGVDGIPDLWLNILKRKDMIEDLCRTAAENWK